MPPNTVEMRAIIKEDDDVFTLAKERAKELLEQWSIEGGNGLDQGVGRKGVL